MTLILNRVFVSGLVSGLSLLSAIRPAFAGPVGFPKCFTRTYSNLPPHQTLVIFVTFYSLDFWSNFDSVSMAVGSTSFSITGIVKRACCHVCCADL